MAKNYSDEEINDIFASTKLNWSQKMKYKQYLPTIVDLEYDNGEVILGAKDQYYRVENGE